VSFFYRLLRRLALVLLFISIPLLLYLGRGSILEFVVAPLKRISQELVYTLARGIRGIGESVFQLGERYLFLVHTADENQKLLARISGLEYQTALCGPIQEENGRLTTLLKMERTLPFKTVNARVIAYPPLAEFRLLAIDRGTEAGVGRGDVVLSPQGLVGQILSARERQAQVLLLTDPTSAVDVRVRRTGARGLVVGSGYRMELQRDLYIGAFEYWDRLAEVAEGDLLVTSGLDGLFPPDISVGTARKVERGGGDLFLSARVLPAVDFHKLREVAVLVGR